jgi:hypothetical protein
VAADLGGALLDGAISREEEVGGERHHGGDDDVERVHDDDLRELVSSAGWEDARFRISIDVARRC